MVAVQRHVPGDLLVDGGGADRPSPGAEMHQVINAGADDRQRIDALSS
jgi:hypothetical protein